jgi:hypothetical protein
MALPNIKVNITVDTRLIPRYAFVLDDSVNGKLDNTKYRLGGVSQIDIGNFLQGVDVQRGKSRLLDRFESGTSSIRFDNSTRQFDPLYEDSNLYGVIAPRIEVQITANDIPVYTGVILDWNLEYDKDNNSVAIANCADKFTNLAQTQIDVLFPDVQKSGERITTILDLPEVDFTELERNIATGLTDVSNEQIPAGTNTLDYLQQVELTEQGAFYIAKNGDLTFQDRQFAGAFSTVFADDGTGISFTEVSNVFGTELLFNRISLTPQGSTAIVRSDADSISAYGVSTYSQTTLHEFDSDAEDLADFLLIKYAQPQFRFERVVTDFNNLTPSQINELLNLELNDFINVKFTPSGIGNPITQGARILGINHTVTFDQHIFEVLLETVFTFILDGPFLGVLDESIFPL